MQIDATGENPEVVPDTFAGRLHLTGAACELVATTYVTSNAIGPWHTIEITALSNTVAVSLNG